MLRGGEEDGPRPRRPLSHSGGRVERLSGPEQLVAVVKAGLSVDPERGVRDHVHGFHSYPARLHPGTARALIARLSPAGGQVADPFCGSGTVLIEGRLLGRRTLGLDLNPLAVRLTRFKTEPLGGGDRADLIEAGERVTDHAEERRLSSAGPSRKYPADQRQTFDVHVLLELDGLSQGIKKEPQGPIRHALLLALSSIFSKVSRETNADAPQKRLASGFTIRFFESRIGEIARQLERYEALLPAGAPVPDCQEGDARELGRLGWQGVDLIVSSPPYPGVLDYAEYHRTRLSWLGLDGTKFVEQEMGARRALAGLEPEDAAAQWERDFARVLRACRAALSPSGHVALIVADSLLGGRPYLADLAVERCAERTGLAVVARGSQRRPHFHRQSAEAFGSKSRYEHLLLLGPSDLKASRSGTRDAS